MPEKITYLLGAGASANSIPVVNRFNDGLVSIYSSLEVIDTYRSKHRGQLSSSTREIAYGDWGRGNDESFMMYDFEDDYSSLYTGLKEDIRWLIENADRHASIDTFAKKLHLQKKKEETNRLKRTVIISFLFFEYAELYNRVSSVFHVSDNTKEIF